MNLATVTMPEAEAREKVAEYLKGVRERHNKEDELILRGYRVIARGQRVLSLQETFKRGGLHQDGTPRLAIVRADAERCFLRWNHQGWIRFGPTMASVDSGGTKAQSCVTLSGVCSPFDLGAPQWGVRRFETIAPIVPPRLRPARGLHLYHVIFEVEEWKPVPPVDPALVRHIGGDLWAVVATWDLTKLERLVLAGR